MRLLVLGVLGFALGSSATWLALFDSRSSPPPDRQPTPPPFQLSPWSWHESATPPTLASANLDPAIAAWLAQRSPGGTPATLAIRTESLRALLARLPVGEFSRLLTPLSARLTPDDRRLLQSAFDIWVEADPAAAARWAASQPSLPDRDFAKLIAQATRAWAKQDALAATTWACSLPDCPATRNLAAPLLARLAERDPAAALALAEAAGENFRASVLPVLLDALAKTDPSSAFRTYGPELWQKGSGFWRLKAPLAAWIKREPSAALAWIVAQPRRSDDELSLQLGMLTNEGIDPATLATAYATIPDLPGRHLALAELLANWGRRDPTAALAWLDALQDRDFRTALLDQASERGASLALLLALPEGRLRTDRIALSLRDWAEREPSAALAWIKAHPDPDVVAGTAQAQAGILGAIARDEPATAVAQWTTLNDPAAKTAALRPIAEAWAKTDPASALQWLATHSDTADPRFFFDNQPMLYAWAQKDPLSALRWAESSPEAARATALSALAVN